MNKTILLKELTFKAIRSSGAGGQHVNKVSSKVVLSFDLQSSEGISDREKKLLLKNISTRLTSEYILILSCDDSRSQLQNKTKVIQRFFQVLKSGLYVPKKRLAAKPSKSAIKKGKEDKSKRSQLKQLRKKPNMD